MSTETFSVTAATAALGYDLFTGKTCQSSYRPRYLKGIACTGSTAAGDTSFDLFIDTIKIGTFTNTDTGVPNIDDVLPMGNLIPAGAQLHAYVTDAAASNPVWISLVMA